MRRYKFWFLALIVLIVSGGGAASGTILTGYVGGDVAMDVSPPLKLEDPWVECLSENQTVFFSLDYDKLSFRIIAEVEPGDCFLIHLPVINEATVDARALLSIFYPYGASLWVTGSGVIDDVVAMSYQAWKFTADAGAQGTGSVPYDGVRIQVCISSTYTGSTVEISGTLGNTTGMDGPFVTFTGQLSEDVLYLHNNPSPPTGDRESQPNLPMNMYPPSAATLYNYDNDLDLDPGRVIMVESVADFSAEFAYSENESVAISFTDESLSEVGIYSWLWNFGDGTTSSLQNPTHIFDAEESYIVSLTVTEASGYSDTEIKTVMVYSDSVTLVDMEDETTGLSQYQNWQITLTDDLVLDGNVVAILWTGTQYFNTANPGILTAYLGDVSDAGYLNIGYGTLALDPWQPELADWVERKIIIEDVDYTVPAGHTLDLTVVAGAGSSPMWLAYDTIRYPSRLLLNSFPEAEFSADFVSTDNGSVTIDFIDLSTSDEGIESWVWDFGDSANSTEQNPQHTYGGAGTYTVTLTVSESDGDSDIEAKTAYVSETGVTLEDTGPAADFSGSPTLGPAPLTVTFTDTSDSDDGILYWSWDFGDGQTSGMRNPIVVYDTAGVYTVSLTITEEDGDTDTRTRTDYITALGNMPPSAEFSALPTYGYSPLSVNFTDESTSWDGIVSWLWDFGDNATSPDTNPNHVYSSDGTYTVSLTVTEADSDNDTMAKTDFITVLPEGVPFAEFSGTPLSGDEPFTVNFTDESMTSEGFVSWLWLFGDSSNSTDQHPQHTYTGDGTYTVSLTVTEADSDNDTETKVAYVTVLDTGPTANFTAAPTSGYLPLTVDFTDTSVSHDGIDTWLWDFGDNTTSPLQNPSHEYADTGFYTVTLTVTEADSDFDSITKTNHIMVMPITTYAVAYQGAGDDGFVRTMEIDTDGQITDSVIDSLEFDNNIGLEADIIHVSGNIYAVAYRGPDDDGYLKTVEMVMDGMINDSVIDTLEFDTFQGMVPDIIHVYDDIYAIAYRGFYDDGFVTTVQIAANGQINNSVIDYLEFDNGDGREPSITHVSGNIYAIAYRGVEGDGFVTTIEIATNGQITNSIIDTLEFDVWETQEPRIVHVSGNIFAIAYRGYMDDGYLRTVEIAANGQITDTVVDWWEFDGNDTWNPDIIHVSGDVYAIAYQRWGSGYLMTVTIATNGDITTSSIDTLTFDGTWGATPSIGHVAGDIYAIAYEGPDNDGFVKTVEIAAGGQITNSVIDTIEYDGFQSIMPDVIRFSTAPNIPPVAVDDNDTCLENWFVVVSVLGNDYDDDGYTLGVSNLTDPSFGTAFLNPDGTITYTPYEGYIGEDSFTYTCNDSITDSNVATVYITVTP